MLSNGPLCVCPSFNSKSGLAFSSSICKFLSINFNNIDISTLFLEDIG